jgi:hypothetical protein
VPWCFEVQGPIGRHSWVDLPIAAGQTYRIVLDEGVSPWDYGFNQRFTLMADLE